MKAFFLLWLPFWALAAVTFIVDRHGWMLHSWQSILNLLGVLHLVLAARIIRAYGWRAPILAGIAVGLLAGQWWFVESTFMQVVWRWSGFAP